jgi:hypothetical protein
MIRLALSAVLAGFIAAPAIAQPTNEDLAYFVVMVEWTGANCPAGTVPPQAYALSGFAASVGGEVAVDAVRQEFDRMVEATDRPVEATCADFARLIGRLVGEVLR